MPWHLCYNMKIELHQKRINPAFHRAIVRRKRPLNINHLKSMIKQYIDVFQCVVEIIGQCDILCKSKRCFCQSFQCEEAPKTSICTDFCFKLHLSAKLSYSDFLCALKFPLRSEVRLSPTPEVRLLPYTLKCACFLTEVRLLDIIRGRIAYDLLEHPAEVERVFKPQPAADFRNVHVRVPEQPGGLPIPIFAWYSMMLMPVFSLKTPDIIIVHADGSLISPELSLLDTLLSRNIMILRAITSPRQARTGSFPG